MKITLATHLGMCFGVRDALRKTHETAAAGPATVLGQLVHNPVVQQQLDSLGLKRGRLETVGGGPPERVIITAHGASDKDRDAWRRAGHNVTDTTCPLVRKAHHALARLAADGCRPVVIGQAGHVEVRGLCGDFPDATVIGSEEDLENLAPAAKFGVISQTTQPIARVTALVAALRRRFPASEVIFRDTVCQPTKDRQSAMEALCAANELVIVIGGRNSNNTRQLSETARAAGAAVRQIETPGDLRPEWFRSVRTVGVTAGTSTPDETIRAVLHRLQQITPQTRPLQQLAPTL